MKGSCSSPRTRKASIRCRNTCASCAGGREPSAELVDEMRHNYAAIGGRSPLTDITRAQAAALSTRSTTARPSSWACGTGSRFVADALRDAAAGATDLVAFPGAAVLTLSVGKYCEAWSARGRRA